MTVHVGAACARPRIGFYSETCFYRTEHFLHDQYLGITRAEATVLGRWGANLAEFPVGSLFLAEEFRTPWLRARNALVRRIRRHNPETGRLPRYVVDRLVRQLRRRPVDLLYCLFGWNAAQLLDVLDGLNRPVPLVFLAGGSDVTSAPALGEAYLSRLRQAFARSSLILSGSRFLRGRLIELGAPPEKVAVHYIGIEPPAVEPVAGRGAGGGLRILAVSRLSAVKGVLHTIRAFARVASELPDATLRLVGGGEQRRECEELAERLGLAARVSFAGSVPLAAVGEEMRDADVFVQHNVRTEQGQEESLGGSILEASAHRLPLVVTRSGGVPEAVEDGETGLVVEPGDEAAMARAILNLARDPARRLRMGAAGRALVERSFNLRLQNQRLESLLLDVCGGGR
jgi:glycosyltransferase involved in cell wall biosynthesis